MRQGRSSYQIYKQQQMIKNPSQTQSKFTLFGQPILKPQKEVRFGDDGLGFNETVEVYKNEVRLNTDLSEPMLMMQEQDSK